MSEVRQSTAAPGATILVGMDAHTRELALCVAEWRHGSDPRILRNLKDVSLDDMEKVYERHVPKGALTLVESSGNTRVIVERLAAIGYRTEVLNADILKSVSERDRINDRIDAEKLTYVYARGGANGKSVWMPRGEFVGYRDLIARYIRSSRDTVRVSNRIFAFCNSHGLPLPKRGREKKVETVRRHLEAHPLAATQRILIDGHLEDFEYFLRKRNGDLARIRQLAVRIPEVMRLMQLPGVQLYIAFAIYTFVEDISRFNSPKKLVSYFGVNPAVNSSGEDEKRNNRKGKEHDHLSRFGRNDVKHLCAEIGQSALRRDDCPVAKWGRRKLAEGKGYNKVCMAVARKVVTYAWYILKGVPTPNREMHDFYVRKLERTCGTVGQKAMAAIGYPTRKGFVEAETAKVFGHLPEDVELQTGETSACA